MRKLFFALISGVLFSLAYPPYNFDFFAFFGFIPLFYLIFNSPKENKNNFLFGFFAGLTYFAIVMKWLWSVYPLNWLGIENKFSSFFLVGLIYLISIAGMALFWGLTFFAISKINESKNLKINLFLFPAIFVLGEYLKSFFFSLLWLGSGTIFGANWTIGNFAYSFHNNQIFLKLSSFFGIYGILFLISFLNILLFLILFKSKLNLSKKILILISIILSLSLGGRIINFNQIKSEKEIPFAIIQTKIPSEIDYPITKQLEDFKNQLSLLKEAAKINPQPKVIIFPEAANFLKNLALFLNTKEAEKFWKEIFPNPTLIIDNSRITEKEGVKSRIIFLNSKEGVSGFYDKKFLTPGGEFIPYHLKFFLKIFSKNTLANFSFYREFSRGKEKPKVIEFHNQNFNLKIGSLICSALFSPGLFRDLGKQNPDFFVVLASTGIFKGSDDLLLQNLAIAKFRAAENNKYLALAANFGYSYLISNKGKVEKIAENKELQLFTANILSKNKRTLYNKLGDFPIILLMILIIFKMPAKSRRG